MKKIMALLLVVCLLQGCAYVSSNVIKLRGDKIKGNFAGSPVNIDGENIVITIYREMYLSWAKVKSSFAKRVQVMDDKEKGDVLLEK